MELHLGSSTPKTALKRPSKGKFKPKQKFRKNKATFDSVDWSLSNFIFLRKKKVCKRKISGNEILKIQDGGGRHLEFRKILIVSARMKRFSPNFNSIYLALAFIDPRGRYANFPNPRWRRPPSWISKNINSFRKNEAILTKFQQHIPGTSLYRSPRVDMGIFKSKMAAAAILNFEKY